MKKRKLRPKVAPTTMLPESGLGKRAQNALWSWFEGHFGVEAPCDVTLSLIAEKLTIAKLKTLDGCGNVTICEIQEKLHDAGLLLKSWTMPEPGGRTPKPSRSAERTGQQDTLRYDTTLHNKEAPDYYKKLAGRVFRTKIEVVGADHAGRDTTIFAGTQVQVVHGEYYDDPTPEDDNFRLTFMVLNEVGASARNSISYDGAYAEMLEPEPGIIDWSAGDDYDAMGQGWNIFFCDGSEGPLWQLQMIDADSRFNTDQDAWEFVWERATENDDALAKRALAFLYYRSLEEYMGIRKHCL